MMADPLVTHQTHESRPPSVHHQRALQVSRLQFSVLLLIIVIKSQQETLLACSRDSSSVNQSEQAGCSWQEVNRVFSSSGQEMEPE